MHGRYVTDILKTYMNKFIAEKCVEKLQGFDLHIAMVYCKPCLQPISCWSRFFMSYFIFYCKFFICQL